MAEGAGVDPEWFPIQRFSRPCLRPRKFTFHKMEPSVGADPTNNGFADRAVCRFGKMALYLAGHQRIEL